MRYLDPEQDPGDTGGGDDRVQPRDIVGHLLLVWPIEHVLDAPTRFTKPGEKSDMVTVDVVDLDQLDENGQPGKVARATWWRPARLIGFFKKYTGTPDPLLGFMTTGTAKQGMNAPFEFVSAASDPDCVGRADAWFARNRDFVPTGQEPVPSAAWTGTRPPPPPPPPQPAVVETALERMARQSRDAQLRMSNWGGSKQAPQADSPGF